MAPSACTATRAYAGEPLLGVPHFAGFSAEFDFENAVAIALSVVDIGPGGTGNRGDVVRTDRLRIGFAAQPVHAHALKGTATVASGYHPHMLTIFGHSGAGDT